MRTQVYLAGAMGYYGDCAEYPKKWRQLANEGFKSISSYTRNRNFVCIDPTLYYEYGKNLHKTEKEVMLFDLRKVKSSDVILVNLKDLENSPGTINEIFYAWLNGIPVIGFMESNSDYELKLHPWIREQIDRIEFGEGALYLAMKYIRDYYGEVR